jgi:hypothetical protein
MSLVLQSSGGGSVTIAEPTTASDFTQTLPDGTGTVVVNGVNGSIVSGSAVASTSGTSIDFTGVPSWVKRITVMLNGVSLSGSSNLLIQIGAGSVTSSGYASASGVIAGTNTTAILTSTAGFAIRDSQNSSRVTSGILFLTNITGNAWVSSHSVADQTQGIVANGGGNLALGGTLDRVRITTVNGTDTFDAGSINILYE